MLLNGRLTLHDIRDVEAFTTSLIPHHLTTHDREDLQTWLIEETWILTRTYRPETGTFSTYAGNALRRKLADWQRQHYGRTRWQFTTHTYERTLPQLIPLNHPTVVTTAQRDPSADRSPDLTRLLRTPGSDEAWRTHPSSPRLSRRAA